MAKDMIVKEILNWVYSDYKDVLVHTHIVKGETQEQCFAKVYALRRSIRYDSQRRYEFADTGLEEKYSEWVKANETLELYYGNSTVD